MKKRCMLAMGLLIIFFGVKAFAWDNVRTHPLLTERAAKSSELKTYLVNTLKFSDLSLSDNNKTALDNVYRSGQRRKQLRTGCNTALIRKTDLCVVPRIIFTIR